MQDIIANFTDIEFIIIIIAFPLLFALRNSYQFRERRETDTVQAKRYSSNWHFFQAMIQLIFFYMVGRGYGNLWGGVVAAFSFWIIFDMIVNVIGLQQKLLYVGGSADLDKFFRGLHWPNATMLIIKFLALGGSIFMLVK